MSAEISSTIPLISNLSLSELRIRIDQIDDQLIRFLTERSQCVTEIAKLKYRKNIPIHDAGREKVIIDKIITKNSSGYHDVDIATIFQAILRASLNQQLLFRSTKEI